MLITILIGAFVLELFNEGLELVVIPYRINKMAKGMEIGLITIPEHQVRGRLTHAEASELQSLTELRNLTPPVMALVHERIRELQTQAVEREQTMRGYK